MAKQPERQFPYPQPEGKRPMSLSIATTDIITALNAYYADSGLGASIPADAEVHFQVPSGGDYSGQRLTFDGNHESVFLTLTWKE